MYSLFLDHSFDDQVLGLFCGKTVLEYHCLPKTHQNNVFDIFENFFIKHAISFDQIAYVCCGNGPGSYTGMRAAASVVQAIGFSLQLPMVTVSSLLLLVPHEDGNFLLLKNARYAGFYAQHVVVSKSTITYMSEPFILPVHELEEYSALQKVGYIKEKEKLPDKTIFLNLEASFVAEILYNKFCSGQICFSDTIPLLYMRKTEAENKLQNCDDIIAK